MYDKPHIRLDLLLIQLFFSLLFLKKKKNFLSPLTNSHILLIVTTEQTFGNLLEVYIDFVFLLCFFIFIFLRNTPLLNPLQSSE